MSSLTFKGVSPDGHRTSTGDCDDLAEPLPEDRAVAVGEAVEGGVCWRVPTGDLSGLAMLVEVDGIDGQVHMKLQ